MIGSNYNHLDWDTEFLASNPVVRTKRFGMPAEAKGVRYPIRLLRYWFGYHLLRVEAERLGRPVDVAEIGVHTGQFLEFVRSAPVVPEIGAWTAVDAVMLNDKLRKAGYDDFCEANLEDDSFHLPREYDAAILLHVLEHLFEPERVLARVAEKMRPGGVLIGGFPVLPDVLIERREAAVRKTAGPMGHVSIFSPERVVAMGKAAGCTTEFLSGAFLMRSKGSPLENSAAWMQFNLRWGATLPWWPGEVYWLMRKD